MVQRNTLQTLACFCNRANFELLSTSLQDSLRFFCVLTQACLRNALRLSLPTLKILKKSPRFARASVTYSGYPVAYKYLTIRLRFALYSDGFSCPCQPLSAKKMTLPFNILFGACNFPFPPDSIYEASNKHSINLTISYLS